MSVGLPAGARALLRSSARRRTARAAGNVAGFCAEKLLDEGAVVLALSDSRWAAARRSLNERRSRRPRFTWCRGYIFKEGGFSIEDVAEVQRIKSRHDGKLEDLNLEGAQYVGDR